MITTNRGLVLLTALLIAAPVAADPITGFTYTYDLSMADPFTGFFTTPHPDVPANDTDNASDPAAVTSKGVLADGDLGDPVFTNPSGGCCLFNNGTYAGFRNDGAGGAPQPKIDIDLGGTFQLSSFTLHYLVEDRPSIYAPQPIRNMAGDIMFNAVTVSGSTDGETFTPLGFDNDFVPVFGPDGDFGSGAAEIRTSMIDLMGANASHLSVDIRTPWSWIFLSEIVLDGTGSAGLTGDYNSDGSVDAADYVLWRKNDGAPGGYNAWRTNFGRTAGSGLGSAAAAMPEPASALLLAIVCPLAGALAGRRNTGKLRRRRRLPIAANCRQYISS
jgi:hypothetical protein